MLETHQIQLEFIDWRSGSYNWESWRMGFLNICKPISKSSTAKRIDKVFLIMFPSLWFKKKWWLDDNSQRLLGFWALTPVRSVPQHYFYTLFPWITCFLWVFRRKHFYRWPFYAKGFQLRCSWRVGSCQPQQNESPCITAPRRALTPRGPQLTTEISGSFSLWLLCFGDMIWQVVYPDPCNNEPCIMRLLLFLFLFLFALNETLKLSRGL